MKSAGLFVVLLVCFGAGSRGDTIPDQVADGLISTLVAFMRFMGQTSMPLPDLNQELNKDIGLFNVTGYLNATGGTVGDPTTMRRFGDVGVTKVGETTTISINMTQRVLEVKFSEYKAGILDIKVSGNISIVVNTNLLYLQVSAQKNETSCTTHLDKVEVVELGDYNVTLTGLGLVSDFIADQVAEFVDNQFSSVVKDTINSQLVGPVEQVLQKVDICRLL